MPARRGAREPISDELLGALHRAAKDAGLDYTGVASEVNRWMELNQWKADPVTVEAVGRVFDGKVKSCSFLYPLKEAMGVRDGKYRTTFDPGIMALVDELEDLRKLDKGRLAQAIARMREEAAEVLDVAKRNAALDAKLATRTKRPTPPLTDELAEKRTSKKHDK